MGRPRKLDNSIVVSTRIEKSMYDKLREISALESLATGRTVTMQELIRDAIKFVYEDNERLRECFRRSRHHITKRIKEKT